MDIILHHLKAPRKQHWLGGRGGDSVSLKLSDVTNWGKGGMQVSSQWVCRMAVFWIQPVLSPGTDFLVYGCANACLNALATTLCWHLQSCYPPNKDAHRFVFLFHGCANASLNKFPFAHATTPIQRHVHLHSCYPQTKNVCSTPYGCAEAACLNKLSRLHMPPFTSSQLLPTNKNCACTHSRSRIAQTAWYSARHSARPQNTVNTMGWGVFLTIHKKKCKNIFFFVFSASFLGKYVVFTAFCGRALWRAL